jgi:hypothetical protein
MLSKGRGYGFQKMRKGMLCGLGIKRKRGRPNSPMETVPQQKITTKLGHGKTCKRSCCRGRRAAKGAVAGYGPDAIVRGGERSVRNCGRAQQGVQQQFAMSTMAAAIPRAELDKLLLLSVVEHSRACSSNLQRVPWQQQSHALN